MIVRKKTLQAVLPATTSDDSRYFLKAILVEPDGSCVATDGHILLLARDPHPEPDADYPSKGVPEFKGSPEVGVMLPRDVAEGLIKAMPKGKRQTMPILNSVQISSNGDEGFTVVATDLDSVRTGHIQANGKDQTFPNYERVMVPADRPHLKLCLSTAVLKALIKSVEAVDTSKPQTITLEIPTEDQYQGKAVSKAGQPDGHIASAIRVTFGTSIKVEGVVMPCRV